MRKLPLFIGLLLWMTPAVQSQTPFWDYQFDDPAGWTLEDNWEIAPGLMQFSWSPVVLNYDLSAYSPPIMLVDNVESLIVNQYVEPYEWSVTTEKAEISLVLQEGEVVLWSWSLSSGIWGSPAGEDLELSISEYAGQEVQVRFRTFGPTTDAWWYWDVFNLRMTAWFDNDLAVTEVAGPHVLTLGDTGSWEVSVQNLGTDPRDNFSVNLRSYRSGELIGSFLVTDPLEPGVTGVYGFDKSFDQPYNDVIFGEVDNPGDVFPGNDRSDGFFLRIKPGSLFSILVWDNDNDIASIIDPEKGDEIQADDGLKRALDMAGFDYSEVGTLPGDLGDYDIVLSTMGCYCLG
ncbi:MAG: hypothetical protein JW861_08520 [Bacteroidales bacterium]|nr:hypothetical protein [Bacteroidales bacterium]